MRQPAPSPDHADHARRRPARRASRRCSPKPWPSDRAAAAAAMRRRGTQPGAAVVYVADGLTDGDDFARFAAALRDAGPVTEVCATRRSRAARCCRRRTRRTGWSPAWRRRRSRCRGQAVVLAQSGDGRTLARADDHLPAGADDRRAADRAAAGTAQPAEPPGAGRPAHRRLRGAARRALAPPPGRPARRRSATADTPFTGPLYFLRRALEPFTEVREGDLQTLLSANVGAGPGRPAVCRPGRSGTRWRTGSQKGGLLIRFAGPRTAEQPIRDGSAAAGAACWAATASSAARCPGASRPGSPPFPPSSPFAGLPVPAEVKVTRQVLAEPSADLAEPYLGHAGRRHPAGHRGARRAPAASCCSTSPPTPTGRTCRCPACSWRCCAAWWRCRPAWPSAAGQRSRWRRPRRWTASACCRTPPAAAIGLPADQIRLHAGFAAPSAGPVRPGERAAGAEPRRQHRRPRGRPADRRRAHGDHRGAAPERALGPPLLAAAPAAAGDRMLIVAGLRGPAARRVSRHRGAALCCCCRSRRRTRSTPAPIPRWQRGSATSSPATPRWTACRASGPGGPVRLRQPPHRRDPGRTRRGASPGKTDLSFYPLLYWPITADAQPLTTGRRPPRSTTT